ncbi:MAG: hypothetical protein JSS49_21530 [Planctomycetes bacterium]|nr:hypothetical protein [Planctomycetota bacterium]
MRSASVPAMALSLLTMLILAIMPVSAAGADQPAPPPSLRLTAESLIKQLDSNVLAERAHAERSLLELGPDVLTYLPAPDLIPSAAARDAVKRIRLQLERRAARESAQSSHVDLQREVSLAECLKAITTQTRNRVELGHDAQPLAEQTSTVDWNQTPFWNCLDFLCHQYQLRAMFDVKQGVLMLQPRTAADPIELAVQRNGPYRLVVHSVDVRPIVGNSANRLLRITGSLGLEPRLRPLFLHFKAADLKVAGADRTALRHWNPEATYELPVSDAGREVPLQFDYLLPTDDDRQSINLSGRLSVQLAAGTERVVFDQTAQSPGAVRRRGGVTVRLRDVTFEPIADERLRAEIKLTVGYDAGGPAFESHRTWMFHNAVYFEDKSGQRVEFTDYDTLLQANGAVGVDYRWENLPGPATQYHFVYEAPTLILDLPLDVNLSSIPIKNPKDVP